MERESTSIERAETLLRQRLGHVVRNLCVMIDGSGVVLQGCATSWYGKQLAQHLACQLIGQPIMENRIEVCPPPHQITELP